MMLVSLLMAAMLPIAPTAVKPLLPVARWSIDYAPDGCTLQRRFGSGVDQRTLTIQPTAGLTTIAVSLRAPAGAAVPIGGTEASVVLMPANATFDSSVEITQLSDGGWFSRLTIERAMLDDLPNATRIDIRAAHAGAASLMLEGNAVALKALQACERDLLITWGINPERFRSLVKPGQLGYVDVARYLGADDYPFDAFIVHAEGKVVALLRIGPDGKAMGCRAIVTSGNAALDTQTCAISGRIRYPAVPNASGRPDTYWTVLSVKWLLPPD